MEKLDLNIKAAILWQLQHLVKNLTNSKFLKAAQTETEKVSYEIWSNMQIVLIFLSPI